MRHSYRMSPIEPGELLLLHPARRSIHRSAVSTSLYCRCTHQIPGDILTTMANQELCETARALRREGRSINDIVAISHAPKSTVSYWCRDIALSATQIDSLARKSRDRGKIGMLHAAENKRALRQAAVELQKKRGGKDVGKLSSRDLFVLGLALYWGEGYKSGNEECGLTNSDPRIMRTFVMWLQKFYRVPLSDLILRVSINHVHRRRVLTVERYWSHVTKVPRSQFTKTSLILIRSRKVYANTGEHYGTLRIKVRRGTTLRRRIIGSIEEIGRLIQATKRNSRNTCP